jgi:hypothetical protein
MLSNDELQRKVEGIVERGKELGDVLEHFSNEHQANSIRNGKSAHAMAVSAPWNVLKENSPEEVSIVDDLREQLLESLSKVRQLSGHPAEVPETKNRRNTVEAKRDRKQMLDQVDENKTLRVLLRAAEFRLALLKESRRQAELRLEELMMTVQSTEDAKARVVKQLHQEIHQGQEKIVGLQMELHSLKEGEGTKAKSSNRSSQTDLALTDLRNDAADIINEPLKRIKSGRSRTESDEEFKLRKNESWEQGMNRFAKNDPLRLFAFGKLAPVDKVPPIKISNVLKTISQIYQERLNLNLEVSKNSIRGFTCDWFLNKFGLQVSFSSLVFFSPSLYVYIYIYIYIHIYMCVCVCMLSSSRSSLP